MTRIFSAWYLHWLHRHIFWETTFIIAPSTSNLDDISPEHHQNICMSAQITFQTMSMKSISTTRMCKIKEFVASSPKFSSNMQPRCPRNCLLKTYMSSHDSCAFQTTFSLCWVQIVSTIRWQNSNIIQSFDFAWYSYWDNMNNNVFWLLDTG